MHEGQPDELGEASCLALQGEGPFTVFAPVNSAFDKIDPATLESVLADAATPVALFTIGAVLWRAGQHAHTRTPVRRFLPVALVKLFVHPLVVFLLGALARALGIAPERDLVLAPNAAARLLAPRSWPGAEAALGTDFARALATPPGLAIGCGRQAALATRLLRKHGTHTVQILDPRIAPRHWDLVVVPEHDRLRGDNVIVAAPSASVVANARSIDRAAP